MTAGTEGAILLLVLFDIDGTLVLTGGAGLDALDRAFAEVFGLQRAMDGVRCDGMTDRAIVRAVLEPRALYSGEATDRLLESYLRHLALTLVEPRDYRVLPGVRETLVFLAGSPRVTCGLATGNLEPGARLKLAPAGLEGFFRFGGYGSDAEDRAEMVRCGLARGRALVGDPGAPAVVVGDTPRDVTAAHTAGALALGVASAHYDKQALADSGADWVLPDLCCPERWWPGVVSGLLPAEQ